jgi:hypothetical protein
MKIHEVEQGTKEWLQLRGGLITSTVVKTLITPKELKLANNDHTRKAIYKLAGERLTENIEDGFLSYDMERGHFEEPLARDLYNEGNDNPAKQVGFITNVFGGITVGFSPDGVCKGGIIEIKSAKQSVQIERIATNQVPLEHLPQIHFGMLVSQSDWCDFMSYSNGMEMQVIRVYKDEKIQATLIEAIQQAETKILQVMEAYRTNAKSYKKAPRVEFITNEITL